MATFGATKLFGVTAPSGFVQETSKEESAEVITLRDETGKTVDARLKKVKTTKVTIKTKGEVVLTDVALGVFSGLTVTESKTDESQEYPTSEVTYTGYVAI